MRTPLKAQPLSLAVALLLSGAAGAQENVLVLIADDVGVDRVGCYGEHPAPGDTPNIDRLAGNGVLFRNAWSSPLCSPTRAGVLTGRYGFRTGIGTIIGPLVGGITMGYSPYLLFAVTAIAHLGVAGYALIRSRMRAAIPTEDRENFASIPSARAATPESINLDPRATPEN